jgi:hypothetical protein
MVNDLHNMCLSFKESISPERPDKNSWFFFYINNYLTFRLV